MTDPVRRAWEMFLWLRGPATLADLGIDPERFEPRAIALHVSWFKAAVVVMGFVGTISVLGLVIDRQSWSDEPVWLSLLFAVLIAIPVLDVVLTWRSRVMVLDENGLAIHGGGAMLWCDVERFWLQRFLRMRREVYYQCVGARYPGVLNFTPRLPDAQFLLLLNLYLEHAHRERP